MNDVILDGVTREWIHPRLWTLVEKRECPVTIMKLAGINPQDVQAHCFESCSFVAALKDGQTIYEICFCPRMISKSNDPANPLFAYPERC